ncbi:ABC transporter permease subunit [Acidisoma cellulosilytica]|uniref:ABC transporter permease subunit n=1 Tax=Acidisoma cellulosilyticum TaxID=2802395 RepID=A0A963Z6G1_9PROT|nr:ABC transporter permease subunit [Acidisoma cellulosilyticum]MCB8883376.1 ABC transporter permease subunit [Acidisoma cellulosilyticum]
MSRFTALCAGIVLIFMTLPTILTAILSVSGDATLAFPPQHWSLHPYLALLEDGGLRGALLRSLQAGAESALLCLIFGLPAMLALQRLRGALAAAVLAFLTLGFAAPLAVSAVALLIVYYMLGIFGSLHALALALAIVNLPFLLYAVASSLAAIDHSLEEASLTLGASPFLTFLLVRLPSLAPGMMTGTLLIFILGATEFMVSVVLTNVNSATLPVVMYGSLRSGPTPMLAAAGMYYVLLALIVVLAITRSRALQQFLYRRSS